MIQPVAGNGTGTRPLPLARGGQRPRIKAATGRRQPSSQEPSSYHVPDVEWGHRSAPVAPLDEHVKHDGADPSRASRKMTGWRSDRPGNLSQSLQATGEAGLRREARLRLAGLLAHAELSALPS